MTRAQLHLVDTAGNVVCPEVESAVERAFRWVLRDYPQVDPAMIANWAEEVAHSMCKSEQQSLFLRNVTHTPHSKVKFATG
jgi:hypothetical protein